jgi:hypothetical protein
MISKKDRRYGNNKSAELSFVDKFVETISFGFDTFQAIDSIKFIFPNLKIKDLLNLSFNFKFDLLCSTCDDQTVYTNFDCIDTECESINCEKDWNNITISCDVIAGSECFSLCGYTANKDFSIDSGSSSHNPVVWNVFLLSVLLLYSFGGLISAWKEILKELATLVMTLQFSFSNVFEVLVSRNSRCSEAAAILRIPESLKSGSTWTLLLSTISITKISDSKKHKQVSKVLFYLDVLIVFNMRDRNNLLIIIPSSAVLISVSAYLTLYMKSLSKDMKVSDLSKENEFSLKRKSRQREFFRKYSWDFLACEFLLIHLTMIVTALVIRVAPERLFETLLVILVTRVFQFAIRKLRDFKSHRFKNKFTVNEFRKEMELSKTNNVSNLGTTCSLRESNVGKPKSKVSVAIL